MEHKLQWCGNYYHLKDVMDDVLSQYNHIAYISEEQECVFVVEDKPEVTAAAEIMPTPTLAVDIIKYNHRSLKGEIEQKKKFSWQWERNWKQNEKNYTLSMLY